MTKTKIKTSVLKEKGSYYCESISVYDSLPKTLPVPEYQTDIFTEWISHRDILKKYDIKPYTLEQAAAVICDVIPKLQNGYKGRIAYFKENNILYRFSAWRRGAGQLSVSVDEVDLGNECIADSGVCFSNGNLDTLPSDPSTFGLLERIEELEAFVNHIKKFHE